MVRIDRDLCCGCGLCTEVCPHRLLVLEENRINIAEAGCMMCGHCMAVCPKSAVRVKGIDAPLGLQHFEESSQAIPAGGYDGSQLVRLMRSRRSCRKYNSDTIDIGLLEDLVKVGTTAPSGTNSQSWGFIILPERKDVEAVGSLTADYYRELNRQAKSPFYRFLARFVAGDALGRYYREYYDTVQQALDEWDRGGADRLFHGATAAILVTGDKSASCPAEDALLATQNILLAAHAKGLGSCLIGFVVEAVRRSRKLGRSLGLAPGERLYSVIALGYPEVEYPRVAGRRAITPRVLHF